MDLYCRWQGLSSTEPCAQFAGPIETAISQSASSQWLKDFVGNLCRSNKAITAEQDGVEGKPPCGANNISDLREWGDEYGYAKLHPKRPIVALET